MSVSPQCQFGRIALNHWNQHRTNMKILRNHRSVLAFIGILTNENIFRWKFLHTMVSLILALTLITFELVSVVYVVRQFRLGHIENCLLAGFQVTGLTPLLGSVLTIMHHQEKVQKVIDGFQKIFDKSITNGGWRCANTISFTHDFHPLQAKTRRRSHSSGEPTITVKMCSNSCYIGRC